MEKIFFYVYSVRYVAKANRGEIMNNHRIVTQNRLCILNKQSNCYGFTLMELMIVMTIFAVLAAIGVVSSTQYLPNYKKNSASRTVISDLVKARIHAIKERKQHTFTLVNQNKYTIKDTNDVVFLTRDFKADFDWDEVTVQTGTSPTFNTDGTINNISTINVDCGSNDPVAITMTITGNLRIVE